MKFHKSILFSCLLAAVQTRTSIAFAAANPSSLELKYFDARGAAETSRIIFALAGEEYKDTRYEITPGTMDAPEFKKAKEGGDLDMNLARAPILISDETSIIGQSKSIERFLAKKFNLMGSNDIEHAQIDCVAEHCRDVKDAQGRKGFSFFNSDKSDEEKAAAREEWFAKDMPTMLEKMEKAIQLTSGEKGYSVGKTNSYADVCIFSLLKDCTMQADSEDTLKAAEKCEGLLAIANRIASDENVAKWVESRPKTNF